MAMTAPGMGFLSGAVSRRKSFREPQAQRLRSEIPVTEKIPPPDLQGTEDDKSVGNILEHVGAEPFPEFDRPLLTAGRSRGKARLHSFTFQ